MEIADLQDLWAYNVWANEQILAAAARLPAEALASPVASGHGTLFETLLHLVDTEYGWRMSLAEGAETPVLTAADLPDLPALVARARAEGAAMEAYLAALGEAGLAEPLRFEVDGEPRERTRWHLIFHVVNHGSYHRGELAAALTALGQSPGELDFTVFHKSRPAGAP